MSSIRGKIVLGYLALALGVGGFVLFASADLRYLEQRINEGVAISAFQEAVQEMRRHEKNYFLYHAPADLLAARALALDLNNRLDGDSQVALALGRELPELISAVQHYRRLIVEGAPMESAIRATGHDISTRGERLAERERASLVETVRQSRQSLFWTVGVLVLLALAGAQILTRIVGRPLRQLEEQLEPLAQGRFQSFAMVSNDREIVSFTQALNRMLGELDLRRRQVLQSEKLASLGTLASGVAHELNNPLGNISGANQILIEELDSLTGLDASIRAELRAWLTQIDDETERARRIVRTLLDYSRRPAAAIVPIPLFEILEKCLLLLRQKLPADDCVSLDVAAEIRLGIDPQRLQQVFINLLQNALDAAGPVARIDVRARRASAGDWPPADAALALGMPDTGANAVIVSVTDNGPGIDPEHLGQIFDPFFTTRPVGSGTGLGLYIAGEIVQEQGGGIAVASRPGEGCVFSLWLPCKEQR
jgi:two-component system, NtrC family, sensor kinase